MARKYYILNQQNLNSTVSQSISRSLMKNGYRAMPSLSMKANRIQNLLFDIPVLLFFAFFFVRTHGTIAYTFPNYYSRIKWLYLLHRLLGFRLICIINDMESLQFEMADMKRYIITMADIIIVPDVQSIAILQTEYDIYLPMVPVRANQQKAPVGGQIKNQTGQNNSFSIALKQAEQKQLTLLWRVLQPMEAGKDVVLTPYYLGRALGINTSIVCRYDKKTLESFSPRLMQHIAFVHRPLEYESSKRIPIYIRYLLTHARQIDILLCFHRKPETLINILIYRLLNWSGKVYVKLDTEQGKEWSLDNKQGINRRITDLANRLFLSCCDVISCETTPGYEYLINISPYKNQFSRKLVRLPNAFDDEKLIECGIKVLRTDEKENIMLTVGRLGTAQKNTEMLLRALGQVDLKDWKMYLVGTVESNFQPIISQFFLEHPEWTNKVILTGPIYDKAKLWQYYNRSRVFILTSVWEGTCIVLSEAQRFNNYLLTTQVGDAYSLVENGRYGTFIPANDDNALATSMQAIIDGKHSININSDTAFRIPDYSKAIQSVAERIFLCSD